MSDASAAAAGQQSQPAGAAGPPAGTTGTAGPATATAGTASAAAAAGHAGSAEYHGNKWWTLAAVCLGTFMLLLDITIVNVALPDIQHALHSTFSDLQWIVDAYALTLAAFLLTAGSLADMYGRRLLYLAGLVIFTVASVLCGFATSTLMITVPSTRR